MAEWWGKHGIDQGNWSPDIQEEIYTRLDKIVQSSALVECINSIIRPYFNTSKNQISQEQLNLIMHYHNHRSLSKPHTLYCRHCLNSMSYVFLKRKKSKETGFLTPLYFTTEPTINSLAKNREREMFIIDNQNGILFSRLADSKS